ncbi:diaminopimelate decarboxylase [Reinekea marinisedimentorum]|uniref:Diaminopimelate decarboxylase n=1 Tax=Reinekea marinisedimentorum TaxID=230495 RepID=A0A4R3IE32_9GAMM|nr:diaminopimelate decarboxylase [Reinekea marinisedimentorum]TCS44017.1 diaminopimelate decarboxylase [Reinekea marinisedimentorum]
MNPFPYQNHQLHAEGVAVSKLAEDYGTPLYVYSRSAIETQFKAYQAGLGDHKGLICFAVKANSNIGVLSVLAKLGAGFDIVSVGELERVLAAGGDAGKVVFSGVAKKASEMRRALEAGIHCFNIESAAELDRLNAVAGDMGKIAPISLRVNPDVDAKTHPYISTGLKENKFGVDYRLAKEIYRQAAKLPNLKITGMDCHIGSQLLEAQPFADALDRLLTLIDELKAEGIVLKHVDMGGGIGVKYTETDHEPDVASYISSLVTHLKDRDLSLILEPGRSIVANAGILVTEVEFLKDNGEHHFAIVDGGMNDLIRPSLYQAWMDIVQVNAQSTGKTAKWDIVGPVCESTCFFGKQRELSIAAGDLLAVKSAGAYSFVMASNYNTRTRPAEVMVDGQSVHLVRKRESLQDLWAGESTID